MTQGLLSCGQFGFGLSLGGDVPPCAIDIAILGDADPGDPAVTAVLAAVSIGEAQRRLAENGYNKPREELSRRVEVHLDLRTPMEPPHESHVFRDRVSASESEMAEDHPSPDAIEAPEAIRGGDCQIGHGSVVIAAITSCTNTSNPSVMLTAGLLAKKAVERGLQVPAYVKSSLAPGSRVVSDYLAKTALQRYLDALGFHLVGYGCTTCIGNSGPLPAPIEEAVTKNDLVAASVLSGNRNFEARIHSTVKANFLMSPPLVVAFALAGRVDIDLTTDPIGKDKNGREVYLRDLWPTMREIRDAMKSALKPDVFRALYKDFAAQNPAWNEITSTVGNVYRWDSKSTYIQEPPFFTTFSMTPGAVTDIRGARALGMEKEIGSLESGKRADLISIRLDRPNAVPLYNVYSQMVYALKGSDVEDVMVNGKLLVKDAQPLTLNAAQIEAKAREYRDQVQKSLR